MPAPKYESVADIIAREFKCDHDDTELVLRQGFFVEYAVQCRRCGARVAAPDAVSVAPQEARQAGVWDKALRDRWDTQKELRADQLQLERKRNWDVWYAGYLKSDQWGAIRHQVLIRAKWRCEGCLVNRATEVHHMTYDNAGSEFMWELKAVCEPCHKRWHEIGE